MRILPNAPTPSGPVVPVASRRLRGEPAQAPRERSADAWLVSARALIDGLLDAAGQKGEFDLITDVNLKGAFFTSTRVARSMIERGIPGRIITITSVVGSAASSSRT